MHVLGECRGMADVWRGHPFQLDSHNHQVSFWAWIMELHRSLETSIFLVALVVMWKIWHLCNQDVHSEPASAPSDIVQWSTDYLKTYHDAQLPGMVTNPQDQTTNWTPPPAGSIKVNVDAAFPEGVDVFWVSMVARDNNGTCVWWSRKKIVGRPRAVEGEALAVLHGLSVARDHGWMKVILESDCLQVVKQMSSLSSSFSSFGAIVDSCAELFPLFQSLSFSFIRRSGNMLAHRLATSLFISCLEGDSIPSDILVDQ